MNVTNTPKPAFPIYRVDQDDFPDQLNEIPNKPRELYARGRFPDPTLKRLCVVGPRRNTQYGDEMCKKLITGLRGLPVVIVSGLALGIDALAHKYALEAELSTIAVLGSGLSDDVLYPRENYNLAYRILQNDGILISEHEGSFRPFPYSFPERNRIMAGMSHAVLVIEAAERSGSLITAQLALEYNRDVMAVPGSCNSPTSAGAHWLIRSGATLIRHSADLIDALGFPAPKKNKSDVLAKLSADEKLIVEALNEPYSREELISQLPFPVSQSCMLLMRLEMKGIIKEKMGVFVLEIGD